MGFAAALRRSLQDRGSEAPAEFRRGDSLEDVLNRHLMTVERLGGGDTFTCILLLSPDGKRLSYGAAPTVPATYCRASEYIEIGPFAGACGRAAYLGRPVYSVDIATDPIWGDFQQLPLQHGFRSCWSTPIRNSDDAIIGTFAILHRTVGRPSSEEIAAIELITKHVADAIMWSRCQHYQPKPDASASKARLTLVVSNEDVPDRPNHLLLLAEKLHAHVAEIDRHATESGCSVDAENLGEAARLGRTLAEIVTQIALLRARRPIA